jgi:hypothetical protein
MKVKARGIEICGIPPFAKGAKDGAPGASGARERFGRERSMALDHLVASGRTVSLYL